MICTIVHGEKPKENVFLSRWPLDFISQLETRSWDVSTSLLPDMKYRHKLGYFKVSTKNVISLVLKPPKVPSGTNGQKQTFLEMCHQVTNGFPLPDKQAMDSKIH